MDNNDKVNSSPSAYEILVQENTKLKQKLELEKEKWIVIEKEYRKEIDKLTKNHSMILKELNDKIDVLKSDKISSKEKVKIKHSNESDESDIFEGLSESKKERIMTEVAELYEANIALQIENNVLKKQGKLNKGNKILSSQHEVNHHDSINLDSDVQMSHDFEVDFASHTYQKFGSFTENEDLGRSHYNESIGSIHNIWIDPTSESYIESK